MSDTHLGADLKHLLDVARQAVQLEAHQLEAERTYLASVADAIEDAEAPLAQTLQQWETYRLIALPGMVSRWDEVVPFSWQVLFRASQQQARAERNRPNGRNGTWHGTMPLRDGPVPVGGVPVVYLLFDAQDQVSYIGSTGHLRNRLNQHVYAGKSIARWSALPAESRGGAFDLEARLIAEYQPYLNVLGVTR